MDSDDLTVLSIIVFWMVVLVVYAHFVIGF